jgi:hypothetical protein
MYKPANSCHFKREGYTRYIAQLFVIPVKCLHILIVVGAAGTHWPPLNTNNGGVCELVCNLAHQQQ